MCLVQSPESVSILSTMPFGQHYWTNFAKTGDPNDKGKLPKWPRFDACSRSYIDFSAQGPILKESLRRPFCDLLIASLNHTGTNSAFTMLSVALVRDDG